MDLRDTETVKWWTDGKIEQMPCNSNGWDTFYHYKGNHTEKSYHKWVSSMFKNAF